MIHVLMNIHREPLHSDNFILYCSKHYDSRYSSSTEDFYDDLGRIKYIKKLLTRYEQSGVLKERLILNHIIVLNNVFGAEVTPRILYFKLKKQFHLIKPFLMMLNILPDFLYNIDHEDIINTSEIETDKKIVEALKRL